MHGLLGKPTKILEPVDFSVPPLQGKTLDEHFHRVGIEASEPYLSAAKEFVNCSLPPRPDKSQWIRQPGWTKYAPGRPPEPVSHPEGNAIVFDTEVLYKISRFPVMAVAMSEEAWFAWISPWLLGQSTSPRHLIPLGNPKTGRVVIGHNIGYDRKLVKEEYNIKLTNNMYLDTMSLHVAVNGMCSRQRPEWMKFRKKENEASEVESLVEILENLDENPWFSRSALNNLADVAYLHCGIIVDKGLRNLFGELDCEGVMDRFQELVDYCAQDVYLTFRVYQKVLPRFLDVCPHPVSFAGLRHMSSEFLPIDDSWNKYMESSEEIYQKSLNEVYKRLVGLANKAVGRHETEPGTENGAPTEAPSEPPGDVPVETSHQSDPWLCQLDWTTIPVKTVTDKKTGVTRLRKNQKMPGYPKWYKDLFSSSSSQMNVTVRTRISSLLLRLKWDNNPLIWSDMHGWVFEAKGSNSAKYRGLNYTEADMNNEGNLRLKDTKDAAYFKVPHKDGATARCTNPLGKNYIRFYESGILSSEYDYSAQAIQLNASCSYWIAARERLMSQMPVWSEDVDMGIKASGKDFGMILPKVIPMGTITRRAVEDTWLTASNSKRNRIGSELKAMIRAPQGYKLVGADVDSEELWIASLVGDSLFKMHGGTALGWMTLEGTKSEGTDLHSKTANILGIDRNEAKIFNYGRIYGAGLKFAAQLLRQFNPSISEEQAKKTAEKLYSATKGVKTKSEYFGNDRRFWRGGTESIVFNRLEEMAEMELPRTPVLGAAVTEALVRKNLGASAFMTSRINWSIQSSGVDYLHLIIASMDHLIRTYDIDARLVVSVHDEVRYLSSDKDQYRTALALQISNLWTRSMFCHRMGINDVPLSCAFFSAVDIDHVWRKEPTLDCVTPSNPDPIAPGVALDIYQLLEKCTSLGTALPISDNGSSSVPYENTPSTFEEMSKNEKNGMEYLSAQVAKSIKDLRLAEDLVKKKLGVVPVKLISKRSNTAKVVQRKVKPQRPSVTMSVQSDPTSESIPVTQGGSIKNTNLEPPSDTILVNPDVIYEFSSLDITSEADESNFGTQKINPTALQESTKLSRTRIISPSISSPSPAFSTSSAHVIIPVSEHKHVDGKPI